MPYVKGTWTDFSTVIDKSHMDNIENGIAAVDLAQSKAPSTELAYAESTAPLSITATTEGTAQVVVTAPAVTFDGSTVIRVEFYCTFVRNQLAAANASMTMWLFQDGASIGKLAQVLIPVAGYMDVPVCVARRLTPSAGSHTYSVRAFTSSGTATLFMDSGGVGKDMPGYIRITRV